MNKSLIIFGIVNITSDSFSDGGRYLAPDAAIAQARKLMAEGADVIDLGPASSNPDAAPVSSDTEIARIAPVLDALKADGIPVSLDSYQPATQAYALSRGVAYLNDIRGFPDAAFYPQLAKSSAKLVVMHSVQDGQADRREAPAGDIMDHIAAFFDARIAALSDIKLFTASDCDTRLSARLRRDVGVLHRSVVDVLRQYELFVKPATETYVLPLQKRADIIVPGGASNRVVVDLIVREAQRILAARGWEPPSDADLDGDEFFSGSGGGGGVAPGRLPDTVEQLPQSTVVRAMQTALRARTTSHDDFVFYSDALCSMLVETALSRLPYAPRAVTTPTGAAYAGEACTARICGVSLMRSGASMEAPLRRICKGIRLGKILINSENRARPSLIYVKLPPVDGHKVLLLDPMLTSGATASMALHVLVDHGVAPDDIYFLTHIAAVQGIRAVCRQFPRVHIIAGIIDTTNLAKQNYLVAGMGYQPERYYC